ncbi:MAG: response regulator [Paludibacteraceae bacterium]|nr:response regulator [Paludibacteraceae bacterium]
MRKYGLSLLILIVVHSMLFAQMGSRITTYTTETGLSQNTVTDILKGESGFIWVTTLDGLNRFDGYDFKNFKASSKELERSVSNQFVSIKQDHSKQLWILNDIGQVLRFNPQNETFTLYPSADSNRGDNYFSANEIVQLSPSELWLIGNSDNGAMRITIEGNGSARIQHLLGRDDTHEGVRINNVFLDNNEQHWLLTEQGAAILNINDTTPQLEYITEGKGKATYMMAETPQELLIAAAQHKIIVYEKAKKRFYTTSPTHAANPSSDYTHIFLLDDKSFCTIQSDNTVEVIDLGKWEVAASEKMKGTPEKCWQDNEKNLFVKVNGGYNLFKVDVLTKGIKPLLHYPIRSTVELRDTLGVTWSADSEAGLRKSVNLEESLAIGQNAPQHTTVSDETKAMLEDHKRRLWVSNGTGGIRIYNSDDQLLGYLDRRGLISKANAVESFGTDHCFYQSRNGVIWIASNEGLFELNETSEEHFSVKECKASQKEYQPLSHHFTSMLEDSKGRLWLASPNGGLHLLVKEGNEYKFYHKENAFKFNYPPTVEKSHSLMEDKNGNIWLGSSEGITIFSTEFSAPEEIRFFFYNTENTNLTNSSIYDIFQDDKGNIWLASFGGGLFKVKGDFVLFQTPEFESFNRGNNKFPSDLLLDIVDDERNNLWILTEEAIIKFNTETNLAESFGQALGRKGEDPTGRRLVRRYAGTISTTTNSGFFTFHPQEIKTSEYAPQIVFTRFLLFNKEQDIKDPQSVVQSSADYLTDITLEHNQSVFSIEYAALDYRFPEHTQYAYKLEPFETEWNYVGKQRLATYTNLPKGEYRFMVKSTNSDGVWQENTRELKITVLPSFWETGWAYIIYALIILLIIFASASFYRTKTKMKMEQEISDSKLQFFTDISHELRTPLTLINAPLENVLENGNLQEADKEQLEVVRTNTNRMLRMMNQIMDFRKIQSNKMRLRVEQTKLGDFIASCSTTFLKLADNRNIKFTILDETEGATFWMDRDKIDTIIFNLLSNAFKFTPDGNAVSVRTYVENGEGAIEVADKGCGMPKEKLPTIFERYTTLQNFSLTKQSGTGIGLSLVKEIVELHKASVLVESEPNVGTTFTIKLRPGVNHFDNTVDIVISDETQEKEEANTSANSLNNVPTSNDGLATLLIVEDNEQLRTFLRSVLSKRFRIIEAANGKIGFETATKELPDFILTDIMMPIMDGMEMTQKLRSSEQTSHIPIILLTAKTDMQSKIDCLKIGANDYITKPFSMAYLEARIENILKEREQWQERYKSKLITKAPTQTEETTSSQEEEPLVGKDDAFMKSIVEIIQQNMDNSEFSVEDLQDALKVGKWHLTAKVKALVGLTPMEFIRETRLTHAAELIDNSDYNMTQITYMIGMSDSRYFSRCFKQKFGVTPTEYKNRKR